MPRTPLPIGTWGEISTRALKTKKNGKPVKHLAHARFRDHDGKVRAVTATGVWPEGSVPGRAFWVPHLGSLGV